MNSSIIIPDAVATVFLSPPGDPLPTLLVATCLFVVGAVVASLSGLVADRLPGIMGFADHDDRGLLWPPSHCDGCGRRLDPVAIVPILGWIACRGRCRHCGHRVPASMPAIEFAVGAAGTAIYLLGDDPARSLAIAAVMWGCVLLAWCDARHHILPEFVTMAMLFLGLLLSPVEPDAWARSAGAAGAAGLAWLSFAIVRAAVHEDAMSGGDVMMMAAGGAWLGIAAVPTFLAMTCGLFIAYALPLRIRGTAWVPMGPAIGGAIVASMLAAQ